MTDSSKMTALTPAEQREIIARYGANPARWPSKYRGMAADLLAAHADLAKSEAALDALLDNSVAPKASDILRARILRDASQIPQTPTVTAANDVGPAVLQKLTRPRFAAIAAILLMGAAFGWQTLSPSPASQDTQWQEAAADLGIDDLYSWVEGVEATDATNEQS